MSDICSWTEERKTGRWMCVMKVHHDIRHYMVLIRPATGDPLCPDCRDGKCQACMGAALDDKTDRIVDCACARAGHS